MDDRTHVDDNTDACIGIDVTERGKTIVRPFHFANENYLKTECLLLFFLILKAGVLIVKNEYMISYFQKYQICKLNFELFCSRL